MAVKAGERNVPDTPQNRQLNAAWYAMELAVYTLDICKNKNIFLPEYQTFLTDKIVQAALNIYINTWTANNIRVTEERKKELWSCSIHRQLFASVSRASSMVRGP